MSERFYINWPLAPGPVTLEGAEAHHVATVCRVRAGDAVCLFNGDGHEYPARVVGVGRRSVQLEIIDRLAVSRELPFHLEVAAPLPKGDRAQFLVEKLTELGVTAFVPLSTQRSVVHPRDAKLEKMERYVIEASKQCGRNRLMEVRELSAWPTYCCRADLPSLRLIAHPGAPTAMSSFLGVPEPTAAAVGPEGGFTDEEIQTARAAGWQVVDLGPRVLRVETAALAIAAVLASSQGVSQA